MPRILKIIAVRKNYKENIFMEAGVDRETIQRQPSYLPTRVSSTTDV